MMVFHLNNGLKRSTGLSLIERASQSVPQFKFIPKHCLYTNKSNKTAYTLIYLFIYFYFKINWPENIRRNLLKICVCALFFPSISWDETHSHTRTDLHIEFTRYAFVTESADSRRRILLLLPLFLWFLRYFFWLLLLLLLLDWWVDERANVVCAIWLLLLSLSSLLLNFRGRIRPK